MSIERLRKENYLAIKNYILNPDDSELHPRLQHQLDRMVSAAKLLEKNPIKTQAVKIHRRMYPELSLRAAFYDLNDAAKLYNTYHSFDWDFWNNWLLEDITKNIEKCNKAQTAQDRKIIATEHANLLKAIGEKPSELDDPTRHEQNQFFIQIVLDGKKTIVDLDKIDKLPKQTINQLNKMLFSGKQVTDVEIDEIFDDE